MSHIEGRWQAAYRGHEGPDCAKTVDRKVDTERWLTAAEANLLRGTWIDPAEGRTTLEDYAARWLEQMTPTWRATTTSSRCGAPTSRRCAPASTWRPRPPAPISCRPTRRSLAACSTPTSTRLGIHCRRTPADFSRTTEDWHPR